MHALTIKHRITGAGCIDIEYTLLWCNVLQKYQIILIVKGPKYDM